MGSHVIIRILWIFPSLVIVSFIAFFLSRAVPGDPVINYLENDQFQSKEQSYLDRERNYIRTAQQIGANLPTFYFTIQSVIFPDTFQQILPVSQRAVLKKWTHHHGSFDVINEYRKILYRLVGQEKEVAVIAEYLLLDADIQLSKERIASLRKLENIVREETRLDIQQLDLISKQLIQKKQSWKAYIPSLIWNGPNNQYHKWLGSAIKGDFGVSVRDSQPVGQKISSALLWTVLMNIIAFLIAFISAIYIGVWSAKNNHTKKEKRLQNLLFVLYAVPSFWLATILVATISTSEYSVWLDWFPTEGLGQYHDAQNFFAKAGIISYHLILPVFCLVVGTLAYLSRQMRQSMVDEQHKAYTQFYKSFGLKENKILWRQNFRNALFPMITILGGAIPAIFSGSLIIEVIFNIPGMGRLMYTSIMSKDWNVVFAVLIMVASITVISYLLTDILYQYFDPRLRQKRSMEKA